MSRPIPLPASSLIYELTTPPPLQVSWSNSDGTPTVYIASSPTTNVITVTLQNNTTTPMAFAAATPTAFGTVFTGSAIYIAFAGLLAAAEVQAMTVAPASQWVSASFNNTLFGQYLCVCPTGPVTLAPGGTLSFTLQGFACADPINAGYVRIIPMQVGNAPTGPIQVYVQVANPPNAAQGPLNVVVGFNVSNTVVTGGNPASLGLFLSNPATQPLVGAAWTGTPTFKLSCIYDASSAAALTTIAAGENMTVTLAGANASLWQPVTVVNGSFGPSWTFQPTSGNAGVLGAVNTPSATLPIDIGNIVTTLPAGVTMLALSYWNIPGYNDGQFFLPVVKVSPVTITSFTATAASPVSVPGTSPAGSMPSYTLNFTVENAESVIVTNTAYTNQNPGPSLTGSVSVTATVPTTYTLIATNFSTGQEASQSLVMNLTPDPYHALPMGAIVMWSSPTIPAGWVICDGTPYNGIAVPDLVNCFILGAGSSAKPGQPLGTASAGDSHVHSFSTTVQVTTNTDGSHFHTLAVGKSTSCTDWGSGTYVLEQVIMSDNPVDGSHYHTFPVTIPATDTGLQIVTGSSDPVPMPPYYTLYFIMKVY